MSKKHQLLKEKTYLGKKGFILNKSLHSEEEITEIKNELNFTPYTSMEYGVVEEPFKVYRENSTHLYVPKFYGLEKFNKPKYNIIPKGKDINLAFALELKEQQKIPVQKTLDAYQEKGGGILSLPCGFGKCLRRDTPIMMFNGTIKMVQDINVGDVIMGDDSTPRNVLSLARGREQMYKVIPKKGDPYIVNESHILSLKYSSSVNKNTPKGTVVDMSVTEYLNLPKYYHGRAGPLLGYRVPITFPKKEVDLDPYVLGYWLGDGDSHQSTITTIEPEVVNYFQNYAEQLNCCLRQGIDSDNTRHSLHYSFSGKKIDNKRTQNIVLKQLQKLNLINNKHIPHDYKCNDRQTQLELLAGLIDSDGSMMGNGYDIIQKNEILLDDIIFLAKSLGFAAYKTKCKKSCMYKGEKKEGTYFRTFIHGKGMEEIPVKCIRKKCTPRKQIKDVLNTRIRLEKLDVDDYYGFEIDNNRRFVLGDFTVTHNTICGLYFISQLSKKTLIIVHKEFLMNQWIERINFALPDAKIGIVQGNKCEIENNDIIIGMLQTLSMKDFSKDTFDDIGHVIIDECHRIPSRIFMKALFKINCKYMLGLSATPNRKDGCTKILKWFIGDIIYSVKSDEKNVVKVDRYIIESEDENYNKEILNFRGQVQIATMVNQIVMYLKRTKIIVKRIIEEIEKNENRQFLILSDRKQQLEDFEKLFKESNIHSVGYYVGGMKKESLKASESCKILLGTYPMANEGLDIQSLNGLILATPKSDIVQSVGRISRIKHENIQPLIIDIIDNFSIFERQGKKRLDLYKKNKYEVEDIKYDLDKNEIFERKKYHYHNINCKESDKLKDTEITNYYNEMDNNNKLKQEKISSKNKKEELFNIFDSF